jgi:protein gp37
MSDKTAIAWTDATWNPVTGCSKVSPGCAHCYAEALSKRFGRSFEVALHPERLDEPLHWRRPRRVFVCSMADLFHDRVDDQFIADVLWTAAVRAPRHVYQILTKRPERMAEWFAAYGPDPRLSLLVAASNVWLGVSIENDRWIGRADILRDTPAAVRFISAEPLLGPLVHRCPDCDGDGYYPSHSGDASCYAGYCNNCPVQTRCERCHESGWTGLDLTGIDWLIIGGESGPHARPMKPEWVRDLIAAARASGTAVFVKQMGGLRPGGPLPDEFNIREYPAS